MRSRSLLLVVSFFATPAAALATMSGCSVDVETEPTTSTVDAGKDAKHDGKTGVGGNESEGGLDALPDYVDPGCPDAGPPTTMFSCDPYNQNNGDCPQGNGCYIYVQYPQMVCGMEVYGSNCQPIGPGMQGDGCMGPQDCGAGFVCVVSGSGNQCVQLCELSGNDGCPEGLVCEPIDVEGFGGCL